MRLPSLFVYWSCTACWFDLTQTDEKTKREHAPGIVLIAFQFPLPYKTQRNFLYLVSSKYFLISLFYLVVSEYLQWNKLEYGSYYTTWWEEKKNMLSQITTGKMYVFQKIQFTHKFWKSIFNRKTKHNYISICHNLRHYTEPTG